MAPYKYLTILFLAASISVSVHGQDTSNVQKNIIGKWTMTKHFLKYKGVLKNMWTSEFRATYTFEKDGTWKSTYWRKGYGTTVSVGQWKVIDKGKKIQLYNNKFLPPHDKDGSLGDHELNVLQLTDSDFKTNEYMFAEDPVGTSYYKRSK